MVWEQRWHPLREEWVIISAHRQNRPWNGQLDKQEQVKIPEYVADCYLCPGNPRVSGKRNPDYTTTYVFDNDAPCVGLNAPQMLEPAPGIYRNAPATGIARVICYHPAHNMSLAEMAPGETAGLLDVWAEQYTELGARPEIAHVLIFENKGAVVGVSNHHPHCQIYATGFVSRIIEIEAQATQKYLEQTGKVLFEEIIRTEREDGRRILFENETAIAFLPYFARYAYEVFVAPKKCRQSIAALTCQERAGFAEALSHVLVKFDNLWQMPFPYIMALHQAPTDDGDYRGFHFHIEFHPPLRKPNLQKFLAGAEQGGGNFLSDTAPEEKAAELRALPEIHYKQTPTTKERA